LNVPTASGAITVLTAEGVPIGHGWGEVRVRRNPSTGGTSVLGELREMTWSTGIAPLDPEQSYRVGFHGGPSFVGFFDGPLPEADQRRATFRPSGHTVVPTGPTPSAWLTEFPVRRL